MPEWSEGTVASPGPLPRDVVPMEVSPRARARSGLLQRNVNGGILWVGGLYLRGLPLDAVVDLMASVRVVLLFPCRR